MNYVRCSHRRQTVDNSSILRFVKTRICSTILRIVKSRLEESCYRLVLALASVALLSVATAQQPLPLAEQQAMQAAANAVAPAVLQLRTVGGIDRVGSVNLTDGPVTGLVISAEGHVLTSQFQFIPPPASVVATTPDGEQVPLRIVATDHNRKLVLLEALKPLAIEPPTLLASADVRVGQWAIGLGRAFRADRVNISVGVVSARHRLGRRAVQTDAAISPANYGGPLIDIRGQVIGLIAPLSSDDSDLAGVGWYDSGIGFAVPLGDMLPAIERLKKGEDLYSGKLGIALKEGDPKTEPPVVDKLADNHAGDVQPGDKIISLGGEPVATSDELRRYLSPLYAGDDVTVEVEREGQTVEVSVELIQEVELAKETPAEPPAPSE
jgi:serine protease Do